MGWLCGGLVLRSLCLVYGLVVALGWPCGGFGWLSTRLCPGWNSVHVSKVILHHAGMLQVMCNHKTTQNSAGLSACILANCRIRLLAVLAGSAPHAWQIQKNSTTSTRRSPSSRRLMRLCSRRSFLASCLWVSRAFWRSLTRASRTRSLCWEWIVLFTPACCEQIVVASKMRAGVFWPHRGWLE